MTTRWFRFILAILFGIAAGLLYAWVINPIQYLDTPPDTLKIDYKTDYVLMTAEAYHSEANLDLALRRLSVFEDTHPIELVQQAILFATRYGYTDADLALMQALSDGLHTVVPGSGTSNP